MFNEITKLKANNLKGHIKFVCVRILVGKCGTNTRVGTYFKFVGCGEHSELHQSSNANGSFLTAPYGPAWTQEVVCRAVTRQQTANQRATPMTACRNCGGLPNGESTLRVIRITAFLLLAVDDLPP